MSLKQILDAIHSDPSLDNPRAQAQLLREISAWWESKRDWAAEQAGDDVSQSDLRWIELLQRTHTHALHAAIDAEKVTAESRRRSR